MRPILVFSKQLYYCPLLLFKFDDIFSNFVQCIKESKLAIFFQRINTDLLLFIRKIQHCHEFSCEKKHTHHFYDWGKKN